MGSFFKFLAAVVTVAGFVQAVAAAPIEPNIDRKGGDYTSVTLPAGSSPGNCRALCAADGNKCKAWTYVNPGVQGPNPRCWLKSVIPAALSSSCCTSGTSAYYPRPRRLEPNTDRKGGDYTSVTLPAGSQPGNCQALCAADGTHCKAWTYVNAGVQAANPRCWLKKMVPAPIASNCCTSGLN